MSDNDNQYKLIISQYKDNIAEFPDNKKEKKYLNQKRKRIQDQNIIINIPNKLIKEEEKNDKDKDNEPIKLQYLCNNILYMIFSYLTFDDILKLKNIGCHNIHKYITELIQEKRNKGCFKFKLINTLKLNSYICDTDSISCKNYYFSNAIISNNSPSFSKIKYIIYNKHSNKNYYLVKFPFNYYFCACDINKEITKDNWEEDILFKIKEIKNYIYKFQFIDKSKVAFFAINSILLYDLSNENYNYNNIIYLDHSCDFIIYKKNLNLLIVPEISNKFISFFSLNKSCPKKIKKEKYKIIIQHTNEECENGQIINLKNNLICNFCSCNKTVKIFDCRRKKYINEIKLNHDIKNIEVNKEYLIIYMDDNSMKFFDNVNFEFKFNLNLNNCSIKYISMIEPLSFDNIFLVIKENNDIGLCYIENKEYISCVHLDNENCNLNLIKYKKYIDNYLGKKIKEDNSYDIMQKMATKIIYSNDDESIKEYYIKNYSMNI